MKFDLENLLASRLVIISFPKIRIVRAIVYMSTYTKVYPYFVVICPIWMKLWMNDYDSMMFSACELHYIQYRESQTSLRDVNQIFPIFSRGDAHKTLLQDFETGENRHS